MNECFHALDCTNTSVNETEVNSILEIMELRCNKKSTILCSQWTPEGGYQKLGGGPIADAILDRIINSSYKILLEGTSMREEYSKLK
ncbi:ATP-binding protein [Massilimicrobiota sp. An134]|uniref:ATP-binding protein n=1 Tax=Massilimicrobiota sp. An134 TaxID=1965557 RepID=UPI002100A727|nr:ATP-binding protein [Massilimicrobiota sp. An134]